MTVETKLSAPHFFFLCPDSEFSRAFRRHLAIRFGTVLAEVGTVDQLIESALRMYYLDLDPELNSSSTDRFLELLGSLNSSKDSSYFWKKSFKVDPSGVRNALAESIFKIIDSQKGAGAFNWDDETTDLVTKQRLTDLQFLFEKAKKAKALPPKLQKIISIIECTDPAVTPVQVITSSLSPSGSNLIDRLLKRLSIDCFLNEENKRLHDEYQREFERFAQSYNEPKAEGNSNLKTAARHLFKPIENTAASWNQKDNSLQWLRCRDRLESIEIALGMIQKQIASDPSLTYADFGLLIPNKFDAHDHLIRLFDKFGVPLANLQWTNFERNLAGELLSSIVLALEGASPKLSLKSLLTNPLLPWGAKIGGSLADSLDQYGFSIKAPKDFPGNWRAVTELLKGIQRTELPKALKQIFAILNIDGINEIQQQNTKNLFDAAIQAAENPTLGFDAIRSVIPITPLQVENQIGPFIDGVTVLYEDKYAWRPVKYLFVLDFSEGAFPADFHNPAVLSDIQWSKLKENWTDLELSMDARAQARSLFVRQLNCVEKKVTFFCPAFDEMGKVLKPSDSLIDFSLLAGESGSPEKLILDIADEQDQLQIEHLKHSSSPVLPAERFVATSRDICLDSDLLSMWTKSSVDEATGETITSLKPQSPSALDDLLICPLGWLLKQIGAENRVWEPDGFTPLTSGLIAHDVMEQLFAVEQGVIPSEATIESKVSDLFDQAIKKKAPYLSTAIWQVERKNLLSIVRRAALDWAELLNRLDARVVAPELWLQGTFDGHPIHGQTDSVIALPDSGVLVVDFKTAKADKYEKRMKARLDLQASLYEQMLLSGGPKNPKDVEKAKHANLKKLNGVVYFTLKDRLATSNFVPQQAINGWHSIEPVSEDGEAMPWSQDVSSAAMTLLKTRFDQLRQGIIPAIKVSEIQNFQKQGFGGYVYESSPLIKLGIVNDLGDEANEEEE